MKNFYKIIFFLIFFLSFQANSQSIGDYGSISSGSWTTISTWRQWDGIGWNTIPVSSPNSSIQNIYIRNGHIVTLPSPGPYNIKSLFVESGAKLFTNNTSTNVYLTVWGNIIQCDGEIGNNSTFDGISFNIESISCLIQGSGFFTCSRIRKSSITNTTTNLTFNMNVDLRWNSGSATAIYNNAKTNGTNTKFDIIVNPNCTLNVIGSSTLPANLSVDDVFGNGGVGLYDSGGSITVNGVLIVNGIIYATTDNTNSGFGVNFIIGNGGLIKANEIVSPNSGSALMSFTIQSGGKLELTGPNGFNTIGGAATWGTTNNRYSFLNNSTVEYSSLSNQNVLSRTNFNGGTAPNNDYWNLLTSGSGNKIILGSLLSVRGDLRIINNSILDQNTNSPEIVIGGNWFNYNQNGFKESLNLLRKVTFSGNGTFPNLPQQTISCPGGEVFTNLNIQKAVNASVKLLSPITINNVLQLGLGSSYGILELNSNNLNISNSNQNAIKLLGNTSITNNLRYIISEDTITRNLSNVNWKIDTAVGNYIVPFGISNTKDTIPFYFKKSNNNDIGVLTVSTYGTPANNLPWPSNPISVTNLNGINNPFPDNRDYTVDRFWYIGSTNQLICDTIILTYNNKINSVSELPTADPNTQNLRAQYWNFTSNYWQYPQQYGLNSTTPYPINSVTITNFNFINSFWTLSSLSSPLPVELLNFYTESYMDKIKILWATASEINNDYFIVYKSYDAFNFEELEFVNGNGNSNRIINYSIYDNNIDPKYDVIYYKLKQVDFDGIFKEYPIIAVNNYLKKSKIIKVLNYLGQEVDVNYQGLKFIYYDNGTIKKKYE